jgi:hypothetical protein
VSTISSDAALRLCFTQSGIMYQAVSVTLSF